MKPSKVKHIVGSMAAGGLLLVGLFLLLNGGAQIARADPGELFVSAAGSGDCSQGDPCDLRTAFGAASNGETIYVAAGAYTGTGAAVITVTKSITLYGGWDGSPTGDVVRNPESYPSTLNGEDQRRGVCITGAITPTIDGFIVTGGNAAGLGGDNWGFDAGGGVYVISATLAIRNNQIFSNTAERGGGLYLLGSPATLSGNTIASNVADKGGGGLFLYASNATLDSNTVISNVTTGSDGGGLHLNSSDDATLSGNIFAGNVAGAHGGGIYVDGSDVTISGSTLTGNSASLCGGGVAMSASNGRIDASSVISNTASEWGGGMFIHGGNFGLVNNIVAENRAGVSGAGLYFWGSSARMTCNTIARNHGGDGSGICVSHNATGSGHVVGTNTILVGHTLGITVSVGDVVSLRGTLWGSGVWANGDDWSGDGTIVTSTVNLWGEPDFVNVVEWNYHIGPQSAAIDAGLAMEVDTDIDGDARPWPAGGAYDIGADEARWRRVYLPLVLRGSG